MLWLLQGRIDGIIMVIFAAVVWGVSTEILYFLQQLLLNDIK